MLNEEINPNQYYSAKYLVDNKIVHWKSRMTFVKKLRERYMDNIFNPLIEKTDKSTRFYIKGEFIINYLKKQNENEKK